MPKNVTDNRETVGSSVALWPMFDQFPCLRGKLWTKPGETRLQIPRKGNKYRKPINDKLLIGSRDGAGPLDVTMSDIHRFESRHKLSIIIGRIVNEEPVNLSAPVKRKNRRDKSLFFPRHPPCDCLLDILAKSSLTAFPPRFLTLLKGECCRSLCVRRFLMNYRHR